MAIHLLDGRRMTSERAFWDEYLRVVRPDGWQSFGCNFDAFHDALDGGPGWPGGDCVLRVEHSQLAVSRLGRLFFDTLATVVAHPGHRIAVRIELC